ncbi:lipocalin-15 isoform X2 [Panthera leo]|uniref:lipocalin-15 isoform X2 n=1 Tax=Panthera leo TaxID=9689 RepID=UPI001C6A7149|nr:lipocalin-15 isoform X2 [Panthera leo]
MAAKLVLLGRVLVLLWVSVAWADVLVQPDFDAKKFSGRWYVVFMVSDCKVFLGKKDHLPMSSRVVKATAGGNLSVHMEFPRPGLPGCAGRGHRLQLLRCGLHLQGAGGGAQHHGAAVQPDPGSQSPSREGLPGLLPHGGASRRHGGHAAQVRHMLLWGQRGSLSPRETHRGPSQGELGQPALSS